MPLDYAGLAAYDCVLIVTDHTYFKPAAIVENARRIVDTRNLTRALGDGTDKVVKL